jgi:8-oxo-dGTP diphosphatase
MNPAEWHFCPRCAGPLALQTKGNDQWLACAACGFVHFFDPKVTTGVLVERDGCVLLGRRAINPKHGLWCLPGGFVNYGEKIREAAAREVLEETGLTIVVKDLLGIWDFEDYHGGKKGFGIFFRAEAPDGEPIASDDMDEVGWFGPDELPLLAFPIHQEILQTWAAAPGTARF